MPRLSQNRDTILKVVLDRKTPFTVKEIGATLPTVPRGTIGAVVSRLAKGGALRAGSSANGHGEKVFTPTSRMPKSLIGMGKLIRRATNGHGPKRRTARTPRLRPSPVADGLVTTIKLWQQKAGVLDRLVKDLGLSEADLQPYAQG